MLARLFNFFLELLTHSLTHPDPLPPPCWHQCGPRSHHRPYFVAPGQTFASTPCRRTIKINTILTNTYWYWTSNKPLPYTIKINVRPEISWGTMISSSNFKSCEAAQSNLIRLGWERLPWRCHWPVAWVELLGTRRPIQKHAGIMHSHKDSFV